MFAKKQIPRFCKLYSCYEQIPEEFFDETGISKYFYQIIFDISQFQHRTVRLSRGSNKKSFAIELFEFCDEKTQQQKILEKVVNISRRELTSLVDSMRIFFSPFDQAS